MDPKLLADFIQSKDASLILRGLAGLSPEVRAKVGPMLMAMGTPPVAPRPAPTLKAKRTAQRAAQTKVLLADTPLSKAWGADLDRLIEAGT